MKRLTVALVAAIMCVAGLAQVASAAGQYQVTVSLRNLTGHKLLLQNKSASPRALWFSEPPTIIFNNEIGQATALAENLMDLELTYEDIESIRVPSIFTRHDFKIGGKVLRRGPNLTYKRLVDTQGSSVKVNVDVEYAYGNAYWVVATARPA